MRILNSALRYFVFILLPIPLLAGCGALATPPAAPPRQTAIPPSAVKMSPEMDAYPPILHVDEWQQPVPLEGAVNTAGAEDSPFITPDGSTLYFFFTPDASVPPEKQLLDGVTGIYVSRLQGGVWGQAERVLLQDPGKLALDGCEFVLGDTLWFCSAREGYTGVNLFTAQFRDEKWSHWQYTGDLLNHDYQVGEMHITADGQEMYFHSARPGGQGQADIWVTRLVNGAWGPPQNVAEVNTPETEGWPFVTQDGSELWFTRFYQGSPAIFRSRRVGGAWLPPELVISQFAGEPTLDQRGNLYFVHHFLRDGKIVDADIYFMASR